MPDYLTFNFSPELKLYCLNCYTRGESLGPCDSTSNRSEGGVKSLRLLPNNSYSKSLVTLTSPDMMSLEGYDDYFLLVIFLTGYLTCESRLWWTGLQS